MKDYDPVRRTATIAYDGQNNMTLGSALGATQEMRAWLDSLSFPGRFAAPQRQTFNWQESIKW